ncbi:MAG: hypothetical protein QXZ17_15005 [Nitrososphaerota archaeon]
MKTTMSSKISILANPELWRIAGGKNPHFPLDLGIGFPYIYDHTKYNNISLWTSARVAYAPRRLEKILGVLRQ